jgi:hypothetical protein
LLIKASLGDENATGFKAEVPTVMFLDITATQLTSLTLGLRIQDSSDYELVRAQKLRATVNPIKSDSFVNKTSLFKLSWLRQKFSKHYIARLPAYKMTGFFLTMLPHIKHKKEKIIGLKTTCIVHVKKMDFNLLKPSGFFVYYQI